MRETFPRPALIIVAIMDGARKDLLRGVVRAYRPAHLTLDLTAEALLDIFAPELAATN